MSFINQTFFSRKVKEYSIGDKLSEFKDYAVRFSVSYDDYEEGQTIESKLTDLIAQAEVSQIEALVFGPWGEEFDTSPRDILNFLIEHKDKFSSLKALFVGDIEQEDCEMSWINQCDYEPLLNAYPELEHLKIRGADGLYLGNINHSNLLSLVIESGGLASDVINSIIEGELPSLKALILWLGVEDYGFNGSLDTIKPLLNTEKMPNLEYLGLKNSEIEDDIAQALPGSTIIPQLKVLDLSMGTLGDIGAQAIIDNDSLNHLELLDLHFHYMSDEMMNKMKSLPYKVNIDEQQEADMDDGEEWRYVAVSE